MEYTYAKLEPGANEIEFFKVDSYMDWKGMQKVVNGSFEGAYLNRTLKELGIDAFVNDEGLINGLSPSIAIRNDKDEIIALHHGTVLFAGITKDGDTIPLNDIQIAYMKKNLTEIGGLLSVNDMAILTVLIIEGDK